MSNKPAEVYLAITACEFVEVRDEVPPTTILPVKAWILIVLISSALFVIKSVKTLPDVPNVLSKVPLVFSLIIAAFLLLPSSENPAKIIFHHFEFAQRKQSQ